MEWENDASISCVRRGTKRLCANIVRKSAAPLVREGGSNMRQEVADTMGHSQSTADKDYFIRHLQKSAAKGSTVIANVFYGNENSQQQQPATPKNINGQWQNKIGCVKNFRIKEQ